MLNFSQYQALSSRTTGTYKSFDAALANFSLGASGELGEFLEIIKKVEYHGHPLDKDLLVKELGDVFWYLARLADLYAIDLNVVAEANIEKLKKRYPDGFDIERSIHREE